MKQKVINLYAGPGSGKSTTAAALFAELKYSEIRSEYVQEFAKDGSWEGRGSKFFAAQQYLYGEQSWRMQRLHGDVSIIITDSPLIQAIVYMADDFEIPNLKATIRQDYDRYDNLDIFIHRDLVSKPYDPKGRNQDLDAALEKDNQIYDILVSELSSWEELTFSRNNVKEIIELMVEKGWPVDIPKIDENIKNKIAPNWDI